MHDGQGVNGLECVHRHQRWAVLYYSGHWQLRRGLEFIPSRPFSRLSVPEHTPTACELASRRTVSVPQASGLSMTPSRLVSSLPPPSPRSLALDNSNTHSILRSCLRKAICRCVWCKVTLGGATHPHHRRLPLYSASHSFKLAHFVAEDSYLANYFSLVRVCAPSAIVPCTSLSLFFSCPQRFPLGERHRGR